MPIPVRADAGHAKGSHRIFGLIPNDIILFWVSFKMKGEENSDGKIGF
ncbi:hypothetical protein [Bacillus atrophaeus]|nr:hypothetical protein [Bacillus atrophaeus]MCY8518663.1 hypothetical protein [Bacillus atrophaeus]